MLKLKYTICMCLMCCFSGTIQAQHQISKYETRWALLYPVSAIKIKKHLKEAMDVYDVMKNNDQLDGFESGGTLDAFRHCFTMAYLSRYVSVLKLRKLGNAHEKGNQLNFYKNHREFGERADSLACVMDLRNNELGFEIGIKNKTVSKEELKTIIIEEIEAGNAWKLKKNDKNEYVSCQNEPIIVDNYKKKWFLPKCLIKSNE